MTLAEVQRHTQVTVRDVALGAPTRRRLSELGLRTGATVEVLRRAPFRGPLALKLGDGRLALRAEDAARVLVESTGPRRAQR